MTTPPVSQRFVAGLAAAVSEARASLGHPTWDEAGIAVAVRRVAEHTPPIEVIIALARAASDGTNETPAALLHENNRAWDSDGYPPCRDHPKMPRRTDGECAGCYADRNAAQGPLPLDRKGRPIPAQAKATMLAAIRPPRSDLATPSDPHARSDATPEDATPTRSTGPVDA